MVGWTMCPQGAVKVTKGTPKVYASSEHGRRHFCPDCGTGLFYTNAEILPGIIDIQSATYDDPDSVPARAHIQVAERIRWMERAHELPPFERYPRVILCEGYQGNDFRIGSPHALLAGKPSRLLFEGEKAETT
jgi:hypothetical protein